MKKRMALILAAAMAVSMALPAAAADKDAEYTIALCAKT